VVKFSRPIRLLAISAILAAVGFAIVSAFFAWRFTTPPRRPFGAAPESYLSTYENVRFPARDGVVLSGWFVPCDGAKRAVVLLHGNGSTRTQVLSRARFFHDQGYAALLYDARGHGQSDGHLVSFGWHETRDLLGGLDWLRTRGFNEFGCVGVSQGGATIALAAAELRDVRWAVLESVYPTLINAVDRRFRRVFGLPGWLAGGLMVPMAEWRLGVKAAAIAPRDTVANLLCPTLTITGESDTHTLPLDAREIFERAREPRTWWLVPRAAHVDLHSFAKEQYEEQVVRFLATIR
jgi:pimeloyl-ACP methyl ester carboxylesterase